jgi:hypothetical protein
MAALWTYILSLPFPLNTGFERKHYAGQVDHLPLPEWSTFVNSLKGHSWHIGSHKHHMVIFIQGITQIFSICAGFYKLCMPIDLCSCFCETKKISTHKFFLVMAHGSSLLKHFCILILLSFPIF